jgi:hypothetical protein
MNHWDFPLALYQSLLADHAQAKAGLSWVRMST